MDPGGGYSKIQEKEEIMVGRAAGRYGSHSPVRPRRESRSREHRKIQPQNHPGVTFMVTRGWYRLTPTFYPRDPGEIWAAFHRAPRCGISDTPWGAKRAIALHYLSEAFHLMHKNGQYLITSYLA